MRRLPAGLNSQEYQPPLRLPGGYTGEDAAAAAAVLRPSHRDCLPRPMMPPMLGA